MISTTPRGLYMDLKKNPSTVRSVGVLSIVVHIHKYRNGDLLKTVQVFHTTRDRVPEGAAVIGTYHRDLVRAIHPPGKKFKICDVPEDVQTDEDIVDFVTVKTVQAIQLLLGDVAKEEKDAHR